MTLLLSYRSITLYACLASALCVRSLTFFPKIKTSSHLCSIARDDKGYEIKPKEWFNGLSVDPGASLTDPRAVPLECKSFAEKIKSNDDMSKTLTYQDTIDFIDKHYTYFAVPFQCGDISYEPNVKTGAAKIFSFGLMTQMNEEQTLRLFGEYYRDLKPEDDRPNMRNFLKYGWRGIAFPSGLAIVSKLQSYDDTESALATQAIVEGENSWDVNSDSWIP